MKTSTQAKRPIPEERLQFARQLRKNQTNAERLIWSLTRGRRLAGYKFRRQHPIDRYVLDFYCHEAGLAIELDGGQHNSDYAREKDERRTEVLQQLGIRVLRFWNHDVLCETEAVLTAIWQALVEAPHPGPHPEGEGATGEGANT